ncbi:MAG TPA: MEDS domain-containing protein [Bryobacteraceae bacterium]|nr:MEDS domain-containing protein [Bryobacteraceae bacterium]
MSTLAAVSAPVELRRTGIGVVGDVPWGTHFFMFHETPEDLLDILTPFFQAGLESNELCLWVISEPFDAETARDSLAAVIGGFDRYLDRGNIQILSGREWYMTDDELDLDRVTQNWKDKMSYALSNGYAGLRLSADTAWLEKKHWKAFAAYEDEVNHAIGDWPMIALCTYPLRGAAAAEILDVTRTHQFAIARRNRQWEMVETSELKQAKAEIQRLNEELEQRVRDRTSQLIAANEELKREITERQRAEEALFAAQAELAHATRLTAMGEMAVSIAHEVTQPITGVVANGNACMRWLTGDAPDLEKARATLKRIIRDGNRASEVINGVRNLAKKTPPSKEPVDVNELIRNTITLTLGEMKRNRVHLETELDEGLPSAIGDSVQVQQVLLNLIMNAVEAMSSVTDRQRKLITVSQRLETPPAIQVTVRDNGIGLAEGASDRVFDAFFTTKPQGMGLGLSICRTIIEAHGGQLTLDRNPDHGVSFQFVLPAGTETVQ